MSFINLVVYALYAANAPPPQIEWRALNALKPVCYVLRQIGTRLLNMKKEGNGIMN